MTPRPAFPIHRSLAAAAAAGLLCLAAPAEAQQATPANTAALPPAAAAAMQSHVAQRSRQVQLAAARATGTIQAANVAASGETASSSASLLPFTRPLPAARLPIESAYSTGVAAGDWNVDGLSDLVTEASAGAAGILMLRQQPDADFAVTQKTGSFGSFTLRGDVTGDGLLDVVDVGIFDTWTYPGLGDGTFGTAKKTTLGEFCWWGDLGDLNGDGLADLVTADLFTDCKCVTVGLGLSTGKFGSRMSPEIGNSPAGVAIADFNGDGLPDVAALLQPTVGDNKVSVLPGLGDGTFGASVKTTMVDSFYAMDLAVADYDLDGQLDVAALELSFESPTFEGVISMLGQGDATFAQLGTYPCPIEGDALAQGDLDDDGDADVVTVNYDDYFELVGGGMSVLLGAGDGGFLPSVDLDLGGSPTRAIAADVDADGDLDVALAQELILQEDGEGSDLFAIIDLGLAVGRGDGSFPEQIDVAVAAPAVDAAAGDLDGDGDADLVVTRKGGESSTSAAAYALASPGDHGPTFAPAVSIALGQNGRHIGADDLDGDGLADLVLESTDEGGTLQVARNLGPIGGGGAQATGDLLFATAYVLGASGIDALALADLDGDGATDVLAARSAQWCLDVAPNAGFTFPAVNSSPTDVPGNMLALVDVDLDGSLDVLVGSSAESAVQPLLNTGGTLHSLPPFGVGSTPVDMVAADFDADGVPDLACLTDAGSRVRLLAGWAGFAEVASFTLTEPATSLLSLDLDRDHAPDLVLARPARTELLLRRGLGDFTFAATQSVHSAYGVASLRTADADGDLFPDVLVASAFEATAQVLLSESLFFTNAGHSLATSFGEPRLLASGAPFVGEAVSMWVSGVPAGAPGFLVLGLSPALQSFNGGVLVPSPDFATLVFAEQPIEDEWPAMPAGVAVWFQAWFEIAGEVGATNGVAGVTQ